ncbi:hypothetical protein [Rathayibacter tanaceti]|uniref:Uncharacterized protein n=2 Tax=Rathayibacter tanaceti TaxID=1671680 RepID=A0A166IMT7_9MICO|nr:hypothetical protein [Rathayibacter tanaceti]KZX22641.1 hypothetical protein ACH61_00271 [Rathayibacter tanaceti]QHC55146.1 hypothetical protein GSU10_05520 [Rathayibacter tanaceti]TCO34763.1 hypothetical protein EV639_11132 [Rathayibacter tanaceti]
MFAGTVREPLVAPYAVFLVLLIGVALVPETVERREILPAYRPQRLAVPVLAIGAALALLPAVPGLLGFVAVVLLLALAAIARMRCTA